MPISGPTVHQQLMNAYAQTQASLESSRGDIGQASVQRQTLDEHRGDALIALAEHYLPELTSDAIRKTWVEIQPSVSQVLSQKENERRRIQAVIDELTSKRTAEEENLVAINSQLDQAIEAQQQCAEQVELRLRDDHEFVRLSDRAAVAEAALERAEANLQEIDQDAARKLPAYDNSSLFGYLYERDFGTAEYTERGFTRRMDRWLAKLIDYNQAKQGYEFLRNTPEQMRRIIAEDRLALDTVMKELERRRDDVAAELQLPELIERSTELGQQRDRQLESLQDLLIESAHRQDELTRLEDGRGPYYREAIRLFREMLERFDVRDLKRRAQATREITDDQIVGQLIGVESKIEKLDQTTQRRRDELTQLQSFLEDLGRLIQRFRAAGFDSARSQFIGSLDILEELDRAHEAGNIDLLWERIRSSQRWGPTAMEQITAVATHPMTQLLINAMAHAAGGALEAHARRAGQRRNPRGSQWGGAWGGDGSSGSFRWKRR